MGSALLFKYAAFAALVLLILLAPLSLLSLRKRLSEVSAMSNREAIAGALQRSLRSRTQELRIAVAFVIAGGILWAVGIFLPLRGGPEGQAAVVKLISSGSVLVFVGWFVFILATNEAEVLKRLKRRALELGMTEHTIEKPDTSQRGFSTFVETMVVAGTLLLCLLTSVVIAALVYRHLYPPILAGLTLVTYAALYLALGPLLLRFVSRADIKRTGLSSPDVTREVEARRHLGAQNLVIAKIMAAVGALSFSQGLLCSGVLFTRGIPIYKTPNVALLLVGFALFLFAAAFWAISRQQSELIRTLESRSE